MYEKQTVLIPVDANFYIRPAMFAEYIQATVAGQKRIVAGFNKLNSDSFEAACAGWATGASIAREIHQPLAPKPVAQATLIVHDVDVQFQGSPTEGAKVMEVVVSDRAQDPYAGTYMWIEVGPTAVCPDLPPMPAPVAAVAPVFELGDVINPEPGDVFPVGYVITDPVNGNQYQKRSHNTPFGLVKFYVRIK